MKQNYRILISFQGGIWRVPEWAYKETLKADAFPGLWEPYSLMAEKFELMWIANSMSYDDLNVPLISAIAARLFLLTREENGLPIDVDEQAR